MLPKTLAPTFCEYCFANDIPDPLVRKGILLTIPVQIQEGLAEFQTTIEPIALALLKLNREERQRFAATLLSDIHNAQEKKMEFSGNKFFFPGKSQYTASAYVEEGVILIKLE